MAAVDVASAEGYLSMLAETEPQLRLHALNALNAVVHQFWFQIAGSLSSIEAQSEDESFPHQDLAALVASKVFFNLGELDDALHYALASGSLFDVSEKSEYVQTILARCIDLYIERRVAAAEGKSDMPPIDDRLVATVERMFERCYTDGQFEQAIGIALESRRLDQLEKAVKLAPDTAATLDYALQVCQRLVINREFRQQVLTLLVKLYEASGRPSWVAISQCLVFLDQPAEVAAILHRLLASSEDEVLLAYQIGFDLFENEMQSFSQQVSSHLQKLAPKEPPAPPAPAPAPAPAEDAQPAADAAANGAAAPDSTATAGDGATDMDASEAAPLLGGESQQQQQPPQQELQQQQAPEPPAPEPLSPEDERYLRHFKRLRGIISGELPIQLHLDFMYSHNHADLQILKNMKAPVENRNSVCHSAIIFANALMHKGTTVDAFLRENLEWLSRATNWAKFSATAGLGVIHSGHLSQGRALMAPYLPRGGASSSPYSEGGALYALGLIHANNGTGIRDFLLESLRATANETTQHGAALGLGIAGLGSQDEEVFEDLKNVLYTDSAIAGEGAGLALGLLYCGSATDKAVEMLAYAHDTQHEKIIRGLSLGLALTMYGREEGAQTLIEQMTRDLDPIIRYGGMFAIALAYRGTANNAAVQQLLHYAVSDVSDDVRRAAVLCLGFLLLDTPQQAPRLVSLLAESYNPHVRYGAAMAVGIACAATGLKEATELLQPLLSDPVDYVRQGALLAMAMVMVQQPTQRTAAFRERIAKSAANKHEEIMCRMGAMMASGLLDAGGRNATVGLKSRSGYFRRTAVVGLAVFVQYWYWYPLSYFASLAFQPTAMIGVNADLQLPKFSLECNIKPSVFAYPPYLSAETTQEAKKVKKAVLSTTARVRSQAKEKEKEKEKKEAEKASSDGAAAMETDAKPGDAAEPAAAADPAKDAAQATPQSAGQAAAEGGGDADAEPAKEAKEAAEPEPGSYRVANPARVVPAQERFVTPADGERWVPVAPGARAGFVVLRDLRPDEPVELVSSGGPGEAAGAAQPEAPNAGDAAGAALAQPPPADQPQQGQGGGRADDDDDEPPPPEPFEYNPSSST